ncbi:MAG: mandelate racemase [Acidimicrobiaceae bacterium]|nr:mandelate racemase [Acidimicrobiaceae bacterium]
MELETIRKMGAVPLRIRSIETVPVRVTLERLYRGSYYRMPRRCTIITRVTTEEGIVGEAYNADADAEQSTIIGIIHDELVPMLIGRDAFAIEECWEAMRRITLDQLRDRRFAMQAISCVDTALWDAIGKSLNQPLYRLWGGFRSDIPMIGIGGYYTEDPGSIEKEVSFFSDGGFVGMKFKIGGASPEVDTERLRRAVKTAHPGFFFLVDANQGWTSSQAIEFVNRTRDFVELRWFEEPCQWPDDRRSMQTVRLKTGVPVAAGQTEINRIAMRDLMVGEAIDVSNFDASWGGGPTEWRRVAQMAMSFGVEMGHHEEGHLASHLLASMPNGTYAEAFHPERDPIFWRILGNRPELQDGLFKLPDGPGLGWELDEDFIAEFRADK